MAPSFPAGGFTPPPPPPPGGNFPQFQPPPAPGAPNWGGPQPGQAENPYAAPQTVRTYQGEPVGTGEMQHTKLEIGDLLNSTWKVFKQRWSSVLFGVFITGLITNIIGRIADAIFLNDSFGFLGILLNLAVTLPVNVFFGAGLIKFLLKVARGEPSEFNDLTSGGPYFTNFLLTSLMVGIAVIIGFLLLIVPGIYLGLMFAPAFQFVVDKNANVGEVYSLCTKYTEGNKLTLFLTGLVLFLIFVVIFITIIGAIAVGLFGYLLANVAYLKMTGQPVAYQDT
ncbi:MAG: hypothetical protein SFX18_06340 [Pirellulales bacterium]|nr:hypothetical protein [Pirellulales bacterium]